MIKKEHLNKIKKIAVLISGRGSNLHALIKGSLNNDFKGSINLIISNNKIAKGIKGTLIPKYLSKGGKVVKKKIKKVVKKTKNYKKK